MQGVYTELKQTEKITDFWQCIGNGVGTGVILAFRVGLHVLFVFPCVIIAFSTAVERSLDNISAAKSNGMLFDTLKNNKLGQICKHHIYGASQAKMGLQDHSD